MSESTTSRVECPVCGEEFDPTAAGGWCTNSECGQWRYEDVDVGASTDNSLSETTSADADPLAPDESDDGEHIEGAAEDAADAVAESIDRDDTAGGEAHDEPDEPVEDNLMTGDSPVEPAGEDPAADDVEGDVDSDVGTEEADEAESEPPEDAPSGGDDVDPKPAIRKIEREEEPDQLADEEPTERESDDEVEETAEESDEMEAETDEAVEAVTDEADEAVEADEAIEADDEEDADELEAFDCPSCGTELDADASFCSSCGEDVSEYDPTSEDEAAEDELSECPSCGNDVGPTDSFCADCGENLDAHRGEDEEDEDTLDACPSCGNDVTPEDSFCPGCGEDLEALRGGEDDDDETESPEAEPAVTYDSLVLATRGEEIVVSDGDTIGRELRRIITESGGDQDEAVRIHREHVRFVREDGQFVLEDLGRNPTRLNNIDMEQGDRKPVGPGDEIDLSGVIAIEVREP